MSIRTFGHRPDRVGGREGLRLQAWHADGSRVSVASVPASCATDRSRRTTPGPDRPVSAVRPYDVPAMTFDASPDPEPDLEGLVIDALEALPPAFAERLGQRRDRDRGVADRRAARLRRGARAVRAVQRRPADGVRRRPGGAPQQDHHLPRSADARVPHARRPRSRGDRHRPPRDRPPLRDQRRPAPRAPGRAGPLAREPLPDRPGRSARPTARTGRPRDAGRPRPRASGPSPPATRGRRCRRTAIPRAAASSAIVALRPAIAARARAGSP